MNIFPWILLIILSVLIIKFGKRALNWLGDFIDNTNAPSSEMTDRVKVAKGEVSDLKVEKKTLSTEVSSAGKASDLKADIGKLKGKLKTKEDND
jgi:hypothetical protein